MTRQYRDIRIKDGLLTQDERWRIYGASRRSLCQEADGQLGRDYLYKQRNLDPMTVANFRLGFVPFNVNSCFVGRIMMPIFDAFGELLALSFRPIDDGIDPKYWNEHFDKSQNLFGFDQAKYPASRMNMAILVEGQIDVMKMHANGFVNTCGLLGGSFTPMHARLLSLFVNQIIILMDGDSSGDRFIQRALEMLSVYSHRQGETRIKAAVARLPKDEDPDSFLEKEGSVAMCKMLTDSLLAANMIVPKEWTN